MNIYYQIKIKYYRKNLTSLFSGGIIKVQTKYGKGTHI
nr:MAG TPA: hypothetical protein [Caudoviricetes sp.]